jgi:hypothetical protein
MDAKELRLLAQIKDGHLKITPIDRQRLISYASDSPSGCYELTVRRAYRPKSQSQLGAHFGLMIASAIEQANDMGMDTSTFLKEMVKDDLPSGIGLTKDFLKEIFYCLCPIYRDGKRITLSKATTTEASQHFTDCCTLLAAHGIYVEEPNPNWRKDANRPKEGAL